MSKTLVVYFSATGQTEELAKTIARATSGNLCAIHPAQPYTKEDLNWQDPESRSTLEMKNPEPRPALSKPTPCLDYIRDYDIIFIGCPVWWGTAPRVVLTFLESADFSGKKMISFATSAKTEAAGVDNAVKKACPKANWIGECKRLAPTASIEEVREWIASLGL